MRILVVILIVEVGLSFAQSNTTAGLAGVGAGAALASTGQSGTASSSGAAGAPVEIQIMAFKGMQEIASRIADITDKHQDACREALKKDRQARVIERDKTAVREAVKNLQKDRKSLEEDNSVGMPEDNSRINDDLEELSERREELDTDFNSVAEETKRSCAILVEDPTSADQVGLYQASQGYYGHLGAVYGLLQEYFALQLDRSSLGFSFLDGFTQTLNVSNVSGADRIIRGIEISDPNAFQVLNTTTCMTTNAMTNKLEPTPIKKGNSCVINIFFGASTTTPTADTPYDAGLTISSGHTASSPDDNLETNTVQIIKLHGTVHGVPAPQPKKTAKKSSTEHTETPPSGEEGRLASQVPASSPSLSVAQAAGGAPSVSATPIGLTYLSAITTALGGLKSNITYGPSPFQPTTQAFEVLVESELKIRGIFPYTSTSALDLTDAAKNLTDEYGNMLAWGNNVTIWTNQCKPLVNGPQGNSQDSVASNSACADPSVATNLAVAQQLITGYTTLLATSSDGNGNPVIVDILRGRVLSEKMAEGIPSLQVSVSAAGGSTKTNSIFGVNLFYTFAPSYNGGVIATFELRDNHNVLLESGARNVLFAYRKWGSKRFHPGEMKHTATCGSFCSVE